MKNLIITSILAILVSAGTIVRGQDLPEDHLGLPGDNLNLYAVMKLFQESKTLEEFERNLNSKDSMINNLDLNGDGYVDYITVTDYVEGKVHTIVLRAVLGQNEYQDVAVFIVDRKNKNKVSIQLIGDEALYGKNYIIEPMAETPNPGYTGNEEYGDNQTIIFLGNDYYGWPLIDYMYLPGYHPWHSVWYWGYWPAWYEPWSPYYWDYYFGYQYHFYPYYREWYRHWNHPVHTYYSDYYYTNIRERSEQVEHRIQEGNYRQTYSRPDLRTEGEHYATMHLSDTRSSEGQTTVERPSRRIPSAAVGTRDDMTGKSSNAPAGRGTPSTVSERTRTSTEVTGSTPAVNPSTEAPVRSRTVEAPAGRSEPATVQRSVPAPVQKPEPAPVYRSEPATVQRSEPAPVQRSEPAPVYRSEPATVQRSEPAPVQRSEPAPVYRSEPATVQRSVPARVESPTPAPAVRSSETRSTETRTVTAPPEKSSNKEEKGTPRSIRR
jgi:hypothetical protein